MSSWGISGGLTKHIGDVFQAASIGGAGTGWRVHFGQHVPASSTMPTASLVPPMSTAPIMVGCSSEHHLQGQLNDTWVVNGVMAHTQIRVDRLLSSENCVWLKTLTAAARNCTSSL
jgi:hypothetical protein